MPKLNITPFYFLRLVVGGGFEFWAQFGANF